MRKRIVTTTSVFPPGYPAEDAVDRLARLGFEGLDMALDYCTGPGSPFMEDRYLDWAAGLRRRAEHRPRSRYRFRRRGRQRPYREAGRRRAAGRLGLVYGRAGRHPPCPAGAVRRAVG